MLGLKRQMNINCQTSEKKKLYTLRLANRPVPYCVVHHNFHFEGDIFLSLYLYYFIARREISTRASYLRVASRASRTMSQHKYHTEIMVARLEMLAREIIIYYFTCVFKSSLYFSLDCNKSTGTH